MASQALTNQSTKADAQKALVRMFTCFNVGGDELERKARHDAYWEVLRNLPPNIIVAACRDASNGNLGDGCFTPTAAMLYQRARTYLPPAPSRNPLPPSREIPQDEQARVEAGIKALAAELRAIEPIDENPKSKLKDSRRHERSGESA